MTSNRLALPAGFPDNVFEAIKDEFVQAVTIPSVGFENIAGGHNGVRYRLRACSDYAQEFADSLQRYGDAPPLEERYRQEKQLFGFFVSGLSALESFCFFMFFAGATRNASAFPSSSPQQIKKIGRASTQAAYTAAFPGDAITSALISLNARPWVAEWDVCRNILIHRVTPGRVFSAAFSEPFDPKIPLPQEHQTSWNLGLSRPTLDATFTSNRLSLLVDELSGLVLAAEQFANDHF